ncbi:MAG: aminotransferase class V-fold PLP-dependent enzyme, partial [Bdellovibrionota bacterium]
MNHPKLNLESVRAQFPVLNREIRGKRLVYLDNAASTMKPLCVIDRISEYYRNESSNVHRGAHYLAEQGTIAYEGARETIRRFIGASNSNEVIFTRGTTESVNLVASTWGE